MFKKIKKFILSICIVFLIIYSLFVLVKNNKIDMREGTTVLGTVSEKTIDEFSPTQENNANDIYLYELKTTDRSYKNYVDYTNENLGISLKYPKNLYINEDQDKLDILFSFKPYPANFNKVTDGNKLKNSINIHGSKSWLDWFNILYERDKNGISEKVKNFKVNDMLAVEFFVDGSKDENNVDFSTNKKLDPYYAHQIFIKTPDNMVIYLYSKAPNKQSMLQQDEVFMNIVASITYKSK